MAVEVLNAPAAVAMEDAEVRHFEAQGIAPVYHEAT